MRVGTTPAARDPAVISLRAVVRADVTRGEGLLLSCVAGAVDGVGYVLLHVFTAHITGNTVHVGTGVGRLDLGSAWRPAFAIAAFVAGVGVGALVRDASSRAGLPTRPIVIALCGALPGSRTWPAGS